MANRSYIYALKDHHHFSLGECPYKIPYAYQILAAYDNSATDSHLFDKSVGIKANFNKGRSGLYKLLDFLAATGKMKDQAEFERQVAAAKTFLDAIEADETLLENGEIYALYTNFDGSYLDGPALERNNTFAAEDYKWLGEDIENLVQFGITPQNLFSIRDESVLKMYQWMIDLKDNWQEVLGLDSWRSILYFQFSSKDESAQQEN